MRRKKNCSNAPLRRAIKALKENRLWQFILMEINSSTREINFPHSTANSLLTIVGWINVSAKIDWFPSELLDDQMYILARSRFFILFKTRQNLTSFFACRGNGGGWKTYNYCLREESHSIHPSISTVWWDALPLISINAKTESERKGELFCLISQIVIGNYRWLKSGSAGMGCDSIVPAYR